MNFRFDSQSINLLKKQPHFIFQNFKPFVQGNPTIKIVHQDEVLDCQSPRVKILDLEWRWIIDVAVEFFFEVNFPIPFTEKRRKY